MDLRAPMRSVIPSAHGAVLQVLANTGEPLNGRQIAGLTGGRLSVKGTYNALQALVAAGIVTVETRPTEKLYTLNRRHLAAPAIELLAQLRRRLLEAIRGRLGTWSPPPDGAWLFGSAARGDGDSTSDIDIAIVRPDRVPEDHPSWNHQTEGLIEDVLSWTGNRCSLIEYSRAEFMDLMQGTERLADELRRDGIHLGGRLDIRTVRSRRQRSTA